ncbi:acyltransferase family protein [Nocardioides sp.]|uniref:acyltransferase family protein n=1 Tax=Nocardioides sp. TaxID=35761 RepID=UPI0026193570|nr:acyltransferase family protein [Nocardioides sp.]
MSDHSVTEPQRTPPTGAGADGRGFRGDIQGLRAIAVLVVIGAHAVVPGFTGGFVGVDIFFVVSGFLITQLIVTGIRREDSFSLGGFYARRARRIVPAASLVLVVTVVASIIYFNFIDALDATRDALWAAFFAANIRFGTQGVDYFALEDSASPLQHYWSLAVEEQFYIVWPLLVAVIVWATRRRRSPGSAPVGALLAVAVVGGALSFGWSVHRTAVEPTAAYFSTLTRAWELAVGAVIALVVLAGRTISRRGVTEPLALLGVAGIVYSVITYDESMAFPGYEAALPVLSAAALLIAGAHHRSRPTLSRVLAVPPLRRIGDWSYSLYLWHWPLIVIPQVAMGRTLSPTETLIAVLLTFQFGYLTYQFVEQPFRTVPFWRTHRRGLVLYPLSLVLVLPVAAGGHVVAERLGSERGNDPAVSASAFGVRGDEVLGLVRASVIAGRNGTAIPSDLTPDLINLNDDVADVGECNYQSPARPVCRRGDVASDKVIVVTGDSHARAWIPAFEQIAQEAGYATYYFVKQQCTAAFVDPGRLGSGDPWPECEQFHDWVVEQVAGLQPELMVVATSPPPTGVYDDDGLLLRNNDDVAENVAVGFDDMFDAYLPLVDRMVLLADVPRLPEEPGACLAAKGADLGDCMFPPTSWSERNRLISEDAAERAGVPAINPTPWLCAEGLCPVVVGSTIAYRDRGHISAARAGELWVPLGIDLGLLGQPERPRARAQAEETD